MTSRAASPIRVIIPCRGADRTIETCVAAAFASTGARFEVLVVDDGGNRSLLELQNRFGFALRSTSGGTGAGAARNVGATGFDGDVLVFIDADVVVEPDAIRRLVAPILDGEAEATVGRYSHSVAGLSVAEAYKQLYIAHTYGKRTGYLTDTFWTAIGAVRCADFMAIGGFERIYRGAGPEDIELGMRLTQNGSRVLAVASACGRHLSTLTIPQLFANDLRKGTEDIYVHWMKRVPLTHNRHVGCADIAAVFLASAVALLAVLCCVFSIEWQTVAMAIVYLFARRDLLYDGYWRHSGTMFLAAVPLTYCLDLVRGVAVIAGSATAMASWLTGGSFRPFQVAGRARLTP